MSVRYTTDFESLVIIKPLESFVSWDVFITSIFKEINGIFAFAIYDCGNLILARDHVGVKPLFYYYSNKEFVFASEIEFVPSDDETDVDISGLM